MTIEQRVAKLERWRWWGSASLTLLAAGLWLLVVPNDYVMDTLVVLVVILTLALGFWWHRMRVHIFDRRRKLLNDAMKARLEEHEAKAAEETPT